MQRLTIALAATSLLFAVSACDDASDFPWDEDDTGWWDDDLPAAQEIAYINYSCTVGSPDRWWYFVEIDGWAGDAELEIFETGDGNWPNNPAAVWGETHPMQNTDWDDDGAWDEWEADLRRAGSIGQQVAGQSTLFGCGWDDGRSLAFKVAIYDDGGRLQDCAIWGRESHQYFNMHRGDNCLCFEPNGICTQ